MKITKDLILWIKKNSFPGFSGTSIYDILKFIIDEIKKESIVTRANSIAFSFFLALFPTILALLSFLPFIWPIIFNDTIIQYIPGDHVDILPNGEVDYVATLEESIRSFFPDNYEGEIIKYLQDFIYHIQQRRLGLFSIGFFMALFFASNGMLSMMNGFEKSYDTVFKKRNIFRKRFVAVFLILVIFSLVIGSLIFIILGNTILEYFYDLVHIDPTRALGLQALRFIAMILLLYLGIGLIYKYGISTHERFKLITPGSTLSVVLSILSSVIFFFWVQYFSNYENIYGQIGKSIGLIIVIMLWIQINAFIMLIGFELNAAIAIQKKK